MKKLTATICLTLAVLLGGEVRGSDLPPCPSDQTKRYHNCFGTYTFGPSSKWAGDKYVGEYRDNKHHGQGTYTFARGHKFVGEYRNGKRNGHFTVTYPDGDKFVGEYRDDKKNGQGTYTFASGSKYVGEFRNGKKNGQGTYTFANGNIYVGEYRNRKEHGQGTYTFADGRVKEGIWNNGKFQYVQKVTPTVTVRKSPPSSKSVAEKEVEKLRKQIAALEKQNQSKPKQVAKRPQPKKSAPPKSGSTGSGFFVSKLGHIITNEHVVRKCGSVTVGDNANKQVAASVLEADKRNDLALLRISSTQMASVETKSLISKLNVQKLGLKLVPLASGGLMRSDDIELGESVLVAGYPYGELYNNTIKVTGGMVSAVKGMGDDSAQFQMDAAVQPGNSGGPIYDENGNIVGVVISQLDKRKVEKAIGSLPENVNFGIKASTVRQFLTSAGLPTKWSNRTERKSTKELAQIAKNQTVMVVCNP